MEVTDYIVRLAFQDEKPVVYDEDRLVRLAMEGMESGEPTAWTHADFEKTKAPNRPQRRTQTEALAASGNGDRQSAHR